MREKWNSDIVSGDNEAASPAALEYVITDTQQHV